MSLSRKPLSRGEKSLIVVCSVSIVFLVGFVSIASRRDVDPQWNIPAAPTPPKPNGYDFYVAAAKATVRFTPEIDPASDTTTPVPAPNSAYTLKNYSLTRRLQWLTANATMLSLIDQGLTTPSQAPSYEAKPMGDWGTLRQLARDMSVRSRTFKMQGQPMKATMSTLDGIQMAQDTTRGGGLIARLVGIAMMAISRSPLEDWNKTINQLNGSEARVAARRLETMLAKESTAAQTLTVNKRDSLVELRRIFNSNDWRNSFFTSADETGASTKVVLLWQGKTLSKQTIYDNLNRSLDAQIAGAQLPYSKAIKVYSPADVDVVTLVIAGSNQNRFMMNEARNATSNNMLLLRLALRAYIVEHGAAPPTLAALTPTYLKSIPTDVYNDDKPLFYKAQGKTYTLWSVGPDMINNGGTPFPPKSGAKSILPVSNTLDNKGDFVAGLCR